MRFELIEFKRCCCCLPLRYGILVWGYWKMVIAILLFIVVTAHIYDHTTLLLSNQYPDQAEPRRVALIILSIFLLIISIDIALNVVLLVGGHKKNAHLLKVYQYYAIGLLVLYILGFAFNAVTEVIAFRNYGLLAIAMLIKYNIVLGILNIGFQGYLILMNRSEILKLENNCQFQFVNNADRAECAMNQEFTYIPNSEPVEEPQTPEDENDIMGNEQSNGKTRGNYARL